MSKRSRRAAQRTGLGALIRQAADRHHIWDVFADFVEMAAIALSNACDWRQRDAREARYMDRIRRYEPDVQRLFPAMLAELAGRLEDEGGDILGKLMEELELTNDARGQFFTPYSVCRMMAGIQAGDVATHLAEKEFITVMEPACGGGAMVIAFAEAMRDAGFNPQTQLHVTAQDVDARAVHMTYLQLSLLHVPAVVLLGNTLAAEVREVWRTPAHILGLWEHRLYAKQSGPEIPVSESRPESFALPPPANDNQPAPQYSQQAALF